MYNCYKIKYYFNVMLLLLHAVIYIICVCLAVGIYSIWFYDKRDCQRIAQLMVR